MQSDALGQEETGAGLAESDRAASTASSSTRFGEDDGPHATEKSAQTEKPDRPSAKAAKRKTTDTESQQRAYRGLLEDLVDRKKEAGLRETALGVAYTHLSVRGIGGGDDIIYGETVNTAFNPFAKIKDKKKLQKISQAKANDPANAEKDVSQATKKGETLKKGERFLIKDFQGVIRPGEMMLVLGRPGSGCTTFLKTLAGQTAGYAGVDGEVLYGDSSFDQMHPYAKQVIFSSEDDVHYPDLTVSATLKFATAMNTPAKLPPNAGEDEQPNEKDHIEANVKELLNTFGLSHTYDTKVGDAYVRGVSGGERRRVSLAEILCNESTVMLMDNSTRGLDANTALEYAKIMRARADILQDTVAVSLYQAGNGIFDQFDKILVIAEGQTIYYGKRTDVKGYFEDMGFECADGANLSDFSTGVTVKSERKVKEGKEHEVPSTIDEFAQRYQESDVARKMQKDYSDYMADETSRRSQADNLREVVTANKHKSAPKKQPQLVGPGTQLRAAIKREFQLRWADKPTLIARIGTTFVVSFLLGSTFYNMPQTTNGIFVRGGTLFLSILQPALASLSETTASFQGRGILAKHQGFRLYRPAVIVLAQTVADLPIFFVQFLQFSLVVYFMSGLQRTASQFFIYFAFIYVTTLAMTAFFRAVGSAFSTFQGAAKVSGFSFSVMVTYAGYQIPSPEMKPWFEWFKWIDMVYYAFEGLMGNEFGGQNFECAPPRLVPYGQGYGGGPAGCAFDGARVGETAVSGDNYLDVALHFTRSHLWRNFGIIIALFLFFLAMTMFFTERLKPAGTAKSYLLYKHGSGGKFIRHVAAKGSDPQDEEEGAAQTEVSEKPRGKTDESKVATSGQTVFTWKNVCYEISGHQLLNDVQGYCKPGQITALMGSSFGSLMSTLSGAGKTTLMDCLAQRKDTGTLSGEVLINGQQLPVSFQRTTGYCEQNDVHIPEATVRESLEFSALLRQSRDTPDKEKLAYVDTIIELLELQDIADALVGTTEAGLSIEQRKRLTIGVELVAKPLLLCLDEPTSGLDGQSSFLIVTFLRKLAAAGQSVICVIHQPSASLFAEFDQLLLLKAGGLTVYFGPIAEVTDYFAENGADKPKGVNPAEFMIDMVSGKESEEDWSQIWLESDRCKQLSQEIDDLNNQKYDRLEVSESKFAAPMTTQFKVVLRRASVQLYRQTDYVKSKVFLHIGSALFNGFSYYQIGNEYIDLQNRLFTIFTFIFVAPAVIGQTQPKFMANRDVFEAREKKSRIYSWQAFIFGEIVAEVPYLLVCAFLYWVCWYPVVGFSFDADVAGPVFLEMVLYEFLYTGIGQMIAAYSPNPVFASLVNPLIITVLVLFCGVLSPPDQITPVWRDWLYYLNPFRFLMGALLTFIVYDVPVRCTQQEMARFAPPGGQSCQDYLADFVQGQTGYIQDPASTTLCEYCIYSRGSEYLATLNLPEKYYAWRDLCITLLFVISSYALVFVMMKLRSSSSLKQSKK